MSDAIWAAYIGGGFAVVVALIGGFFALRQNRNKSDDSAEPKASNSYNITTGDVGSDTVVGHNNTILKIIEGDPTASAAYQAQVKEIEELKLERQQKDQTIEQMAQTIATLVKEKAASSQPDKYDFALKGLATGDKSLADQLLEDAINEGESGIVRTAEMCRERGALWFASDTQKALAAYKRATELDPSNLPAWNQLGHLYKRVGKLDAAISAYEQILALPDDKASEATAIGNLGMIYWTLGDLDKAEEYQLKALALSEELGLKEGMASGYGNLGLIYQVRGDLDKAEEYLFKSLALDKEIGRKEGIASTHCNLGLIYGARGDLDKAEEYHLKALALNKELGHKESMASDYSNLGRIYGIRGELDQAEEYLLKTLALDKELGHKEGMAIDYGNLGSVYRQLGNLDEAEKYYLKSLAIDEQLGRKEGMVYQYGNLGILYKQRGNKPIASSYWKKSVALYKEMGIEHKAEIVQSLIDDLEID